MLDEQLLRAIRFRFFKEIRYSGKDYLEKLFDTLLLHSLTTGKTIIIDKHIRFERIGQNTQWKIDFTNYLTTNCRASYEWLNHLRLSRLRALGLLTLRNHLNQQMIKQRRSEINQRLQQEVTNRLEKEQQSSGRHRGRRTGLAERRDKLLAEYYDLESFRMQQIALNERKFDIDLPAVQPDELPPEQQQSSAAGQRVQNVINELSCLQNWRYANQIFNLRGGRQKKISKFRRSRPTKMPFLQIQFLQTSFSCKATARFERTSTSVCRCHETTSKRTTRR